jgi:hypothetical protein
MIFGQNFVGKSAHLEACSNNSLIGRFVDEVTRSPEHKFDPILARELLFKISFAEKLHSGGEKLFSNEALTAGGRLDHSVIAHRLKLIKPDAKILITLRHPLKLLRSQHAHGYRSRKISQASFLRWLDETLKSAQRHDCLIKNTRVNQYVLPKIIKMYNDIFGKANVFIVYLEDYLAQPEKFMEVFRRFDLPNVDILNEINYQDLASTFHNKAPNILSSAPLRMQKRLTVYWFSNNFFQNKWRINQSRSTTRLLETVLNYLLKDLTLLDEATYHDFARRNYTNVPKDILHF